MIGQVRAYSEQGWEGMVIAAKEDLSMEDAWSAFAESNTTQVAFREIIEYIPSQSPYRMGMSYLEGFETLIPEKFHPTRPLTSSQWFAYFYDPQVAAEGGGFAFSVFAEGYMNFGLIGVLVVAFVEGALARRFTEIRWAAPENKSRLLIVAAVATQLPYTIRGEFASLLKQNFVMVLLPTLIAAMYLGRKKAPAAARIARAGR
jgi:oligosaccharide repeat unit polymerase